MEDDILLIGGRKVVLVLTKAKALILDLLNNLDKTGAVSLKSALFIRKCNEP